jgi:hypothetical protein
MTGNNSNSDGNLPSRWRWEWRVREVMKRAQTLII